MKGFLRNLSQIIEVLDTVRNRILRFALELEKESPQTGEEGAPVVEETKVQQIFNTYVTGSATNVNVGGHQQITYNVEVTVNQGDFESLKQFLISNGVVEADIAGLKTAIEEDDSSESLPGFGSKVQSWIGNMISKAATGAWDIAAATAASLLAHALMKYYGM